MRSSSTIHIMAIALAVIVSCPSIVAAAPLWQLDQAKAFADAEVTIERMRAQATPDWAGIKEQYEKTLPIVRKIDQVSQVTYEKEIGEALVKCASGEDAAINQQIVGKGLQHVAVLAIREEFKGLTAVKANAEELKAGVGRIAALFEGIRPTFTRRDKDFFEAKKTLEAEAEKALESLTKAPDQGPDAVVSGQMLLENAILRTYALCVLFEIEDVEKLRDTDLKKCEVKRMEGVVFYRIIQPRVKRSDPKADETILAMLKASPANMSAATMKDALTKGLPGIPLK